MAGGALNLKKMKSSKIEWRTVEILSMGSPSRRGENEEENQSIPGDISPAKISHQKTEAVREIKEEQEESEHQDWFKFN